MEQQDMTRAEIQRMRRRAEMLGVTITKSRRKYASILDAGKWRIVNSRGLILAGEFFELEPEQVDGYLDEYAARLMRTADDVRQIAKPTQANTQHTETYPIAAKRAPKMAVHKAPKVAVHKAPNISKTKAGGSLYRVSWFDKTVTVEAESPEAAAAHVADGVGVTPDKVNVWKVE